jgi:nucleotide-binding universal stress UspA family protein
MAPIRRILVAVDFTETSDHALDYAIEFASKLDAQITALHVYELPIYGFPDGALITTADMASRISSSAQKGLDAVLEARAGRGVRLTGLLRQGTVWEEINAVAKEIEADLIVIGTHGRRGLSRALLGSVAESVIRTATRPVLTIHGLQRAE